MHNFNSVISVLHCFYNSHLYIKGLIRCTACRGIVRNAQTSLQKHGPTTEYGSKSRRRRTFRENWICRDSCKEFLPGVFVH